MDIFESYLQKKQSSNIIKRALTDVSMKSGIILFRKINRTRILKFWVPKF